MLNEKELSQIRQNARIHTEFFLQLKKFVVPGINSVQVNDFAGEFCEKYSVLPAFRGQYGFPGNICVSINECVVHGIPQKKDIFKPGDLITFDFGVKDKKHFLYTDACLTMIIGGRENYPEKNHFLKIAEIAMKKGIEKAKEGNRVGDISEEIQKTVEGNDFFIIKELTGHGLGKTLHEKPYIYNYGTKGSGPKITKGMVLAIEPIIGNQTSKIFAKGNHNIVMQKGIGCQVESMIIVGDKGPEILISVLQN